MTNQNELGQRTVALRAEALLISNSKLSGIYKGRRCSTPMVLDDDRTIKGLVIANALALHLAGIYSRRLTASLKKRSIKDPRKVAELNRTIRSSIQIYCRSAMSFLYPEMCEKTFNVKWLPYLTEGQSSHEAVKILLPIALKNLSEVAYCSKDTFEHSLLSPLIEFLVAIGKDIVRQPKLTCCERTEKNLEAVESYVSDSKCVSSMTVPYRMPLKQSSVPGAVQRFLLRFLPDYDGSSNHVDGELIKLNQQIAFFDSKVKGHIGSPLSIVN